MTWSGSNRGMLRRLRSHKRRKAGLWSHFSVYEVWDNIRDDEIRELERLFRLLLGSPSANRSPAPTEDLPPTWMRVMRIQACFVG
jgi:hypothetical protein